MPNYCKVSLERLRDIMKNFIREYGSKNFHPLECCEVDGRDRVVCTLNAAAMLECVWVKELSPTSTVLGHARLPLVRIRGYKEIRALPPASDKTMVS